MNRVYSESINSADEGISFEIAKNDPKAEILNPYTTGYTRRWEVWETEDNKLLNYGPITSIADQITTWKVTGAGRSALLADYIDSKKTFYGQLYHLVKDITYENLATQPRTSVLVPDTVTSGEQTLIFGNSVVINEKYHGLSEKTMYNAIDNDNGQFKPGQIEPVNTFRTHDTYWSGMSRSDSHIVDLGGIYNVNRIVYSFPGWGGPQRITNRSYTFEISIATDQGTTTHLQDRDFGDFEVIYSSQVPNKIRSAIYVHIGLDDDDNLVAEPDYTTETPVILNLRPVPVRYIRMRILNTHAWYSNQEIDGWEYQCDPDYQAGDVPGFNPASSGPRLADPINDRILEPPNDCHASITEIRVNREIVNVNYIKKLALQRIDNNNLQIKYSHDAESGETITTDNGLRKFEPGSFFRKVRFTYSGASTTYNKFFDDDCSNCYPNGFQFGIMDQNNSLVYATDTSSGTNVSRTFGAFTKELQMKGASNAVITWCDAWPAKTDALSFGGSYSYSTVAGDTASIHFRGQSFKLYSTVPADETGAEIDIDIRENTGSGWTSYTPLATITLPNDISGELVYEITYESGTLQSDRTYEIRITNNDGGYASIDSVEGYWESSMTEYNEDSTRIGVGYLDRVKQIYDQRFSNGSMYKVDEQNWFQMRFTGDRVIAMSAKGRNHGIVRLSLRRTDDDAQIGDFDFGELDIVPIPGGESDGKLHIDLDTGKRGNEITQYILFDSDDYFDDGLPWGTYLIVVSYHDDDEQTYTSPSADIDFDSFVPRCRDCQPSSGEDITVVRPVFFDGYIVHETVGLSVSFDNETQLEMLASVAEAAQVEWNIDADGLIFEPRIGTDTEEYLREGENTLVDWEIVNDISKVASILVSSGADIDGLPLFTITENKATREQLGRTVMRQHDFRSVASYFQLVGLSRTELVRRQVPEKRIRVSHVANSLGLRKGDSFILWTRKGERMRVRILRKETTETSGRVYNLECVTWPQII